MLARSLTRREFYSLAGEVTSYQMRNLVVPTFHVFRRQIRVSFVWPVAYEIIGLRNAWCSSELRSAVRELLES